MNYDVFISYSRKDQHFADALLHHLEANSVKCWIDHRDLFVGSNWGAEIDYAIKGNPGLVLILIFSSHVNESTQIFKELNLADSHTIPIMPIRIEDVAPLGDYAYHLSHLNWMDVFGEEERKNIEQITEKIKASITRIRERKGLPVSLPAEKPHTDSTTVRDEGIKEDPSAPDKLAVSNLPWPEVGIDFLKNLKNKFDITLLPFEPDKISSDEDIEGPEPEFDWCVDDTYYFAVWFTNKRLEKVDLRWGYYSEHEKRDPLFRKTADAFSQNETWLNDDEDVLINDDIYSFDQEKGYLGFETSQRKTISSLSDPALVEVIAKKMTIFSQSVWPIIVKNREK